MRVGAATALPTVPMRDIQKETAHQKQAFPWQLQALPRKPVKVSANTITMQSPEHPALTSAIPVAQGGGVVIDGTKTNQSFTVSKAALNQVNSAKAQATALNGTVLNVVNISGSVSFNTANVNYYMPGITGTENIQVYQLAGGQWTPVTVTEVRADHVIVDMTSYGVLAFIQVP